MAPAQLHPYIGMMPPSQHAPRPPGTPHHTRTLDESCPQQGAWAPNLCTVCKIAISCVNSSLGRGLRGQQDQSDGQVVTLGEAGATREGKSWCNNTELCTTWAHRDGPGMAHTSDLGQTALAHGSVSTLPPQPRASPGLPEGWQPWERQPWGWHSKDRG